MFNKQYNKVEPIEPPAGEADQLLYAIAPMQGYDCYAQWFQTDKI